MAANTLNITAAHDKTRFALHGDMSVAFNNAVSNTFTVILMTISDETFLINSSTFQFRDLTGTLVSGFSFGGRPALFLELMFDPIGGVWYITANNVVNLGSSSVSEGTLTLNATSGALTPVNCATRNNFSLLMTANGKLENISNAVPGTKITIIIKQDATGSRKLDYDTKYAFLGNQFPVLSTSPNAMDILSGYITSNGDFLCELKKNYAVITGIAKVLETGDVFYTLGTVGATVPTTGTVQILRSGNFAEATGSFGVGAAADYSFSIIGTSNTSERPQLLLAADTRPAFGKGILNIEGGSSTISDIVLTGARSVDDNGAGIRLNPTVIYSKIERVKCYNNEDGIITGPGAWTFDMIDCEMVENGQAGKISGRGFTHNIYAGEIDSWSALRCSFLRSKFGHDIKSRARQCILNQVLAQGSVEGREFDTPNGGKIYATNCIFIKEGDAIQNCLIGIGHEGIVNLTQEYIFTNCRFEHRVADGSRELTILENMNGTGVNTVKVTFVDCTFVKVATNRNLPLYFVGPYEIINTGGTQGPLLEAGVPSTLPPPPSVNTVSVPLTAFAIDATTLSEYSAAINAASIPNKRVAGATSIVNAFKPDYRLYIYRDDVLIIPAQYTGDMGITNDGTNVFITLGVPDSAEATQSADLSTGVWRFELQGGSSYSRVISGSVGSTYSSANLKLSGNPVAGSGLAQNIKFIVPRSVDGL